MGISNLDARGLFTKMTIDKYKEMSKPTAFLRSFFPEKIVPTKEVAISVQRGNELVAVNVERGTEGNRNSGGKSTEKIFIPPFYKEYYDATNLDLYDRAIGSDDPAIFAALVEDMAEQLMILRNKIERAYELQCAQVLETGIVTLVNGDNIDFKRKADSLKDNSGTPWTGANNPYTQLETGCNFIRQKGKAQGSVINAIFGSSALTAFLANTSVTGRADIRNITLDAVRTPQKNALGGTLHGEVAVGAYLVRIWSYPEFYDTASAANNAYVNPKKVIMMPEDPRFHLAFGAVPQLITSGVPVRGAYKVGEYVDERQAAHVFDIASAGVAIPVAVDQLYTMQVVA